MFSKNSLSIICLVLLGLTKTNWALCRGITANGLTLEITEMDEFSHFRLRCSGHGANNEWESNVSQWNTAAQRDLYLKKSGETQFIDWGAVKGNAVTITCTNRSNGWAEATGTIRKGSCSF